MNQARWLELQDLLHAVWTLPPEERASYLERQCPDSELRAKAEALLVADDAADAFFERLARDAGVTHGEQTEPDDFPGRLVGRYRLLEPLGRGGMGIVYLAERADGAFEQQVAIKLLPMGVSGPEGQRRFLAERQILAGLEHRGIARLLDGGVTEDKTPYFVMERVEGQRIDRWCDAHRLRIRERLGLLRRVCEAVEYAHRRLIVHRDLKPANVLVTGDGDPKLLDFGVAKLLTDVDTELTRTRDAAPLTPAWAAPEQLEGGAVTTATDTYALGALAYLLLAGVPPHELKEHSPAAVLRELQSEPPAPSRKLASLPEAEQVEIAAARSASAGELRRGLTGDLDAILLQALAPDPAHRYGSAGELAADLEAHLEGQPVAARAPSAGYRLGRFLTRHRTAVAGAAAVVVLLAGLVVVSIESALTSRRQAQQVAAERDRAEFERTEAEAVRAFMENVLLSAEPTSGLGPDATILAGLDRIVEQYGDDGISGSTAVDATVRLAIGQVYTRLGRYDEAEALVRRAYEARLATLEPEHPDVAEVLFELAEIEIGRAAFDSAATLFGRALEIRRAALDPLSTRTAHTLNRLGWALANQGDVNGARAALEQAVEIFRAQDEPTADLADPLAILSQVERLAGQAERAERVAREALEIRERLLPPDHTKLGESYNNLAVVLDDLGRREEAAPLYRRAIEIQEAIYGPDSEFVAATWSNLGILLTDLGRFDEGRAALLRAWEIDRAALGADHLYVGLDRQNLARHYCIAGQPDEGRAHIEATLAIYRSALAEDHWQIATARSVHGVCLWRLDALEQAETELTAALERLEREFDADNINVQTALDRLVQFYEDTGRAGSPIE